MPLTSHPVVGEAVLNCININTTGLRWCQDLVFAVSRCADKLLPLVWKYTKQIKWLPCPSSYARDLWQKRYDSGISYKRDRKKYTECEIVDHERGSFYCQQETHHIQQRGRRLFANYSVTSSGSVKPSQIPDTSNHASIHCPAAVLIAFAVGAGLCHMRRPPSCFGSHNTDQRLGCQRGTNR